MTWNKILTMLAAVFGFVAGLFGEWTAAMTVLVVLMAIDYITGCICGFCGKSPKTPNGHWLSSYAFKGLMHKGITMLVILVAAQLDIVISAGASTFKTMAVFYYISCEGLSVVENVGLLGVPLPPFLKNALEVLKAKNSESKHDDKNITDKESE